MYQGKAPLPNQLKLAFDSSQWPDNFKVNRRLEVANEPEGISLSLSCLLIVASKSGTAAGDLLISDLEHLEYDACFRRIPPDTFHIAGPFQLCFPTER